MTDVSDITHVAAFFERTAQDAHAARIGFATLAAQNACSRSNNRNPTACEDKYEDSG
jgi:hypothetical protein